MPHVSLDDVAVSAGDDTVDLVALDRAMNALMRIDPRKVQIVEMRFFGGLSVEETAEVLNISPITVKRAGEPPAHGSIVNWPVLQWPIRASRLGPARRLLCMRY